MKRQHINKVVLILLIISLVSGCGLTKDTVGLPQGQKQQFIRERVALYTNNHFDTIKTIKLNFSEEDKIALFVEFTPNFGSITFKNEIWQWSAAHALTLIKIFPEITFFEYRVIDKDEGHLMDLIIDEFGLKSLEENYYGQKGPGNSYSSCFSKVVETPRGRSLPLDERFFEGSGLP